MSPSIAPGSLPFGLRPYAVLVSHILPRTSVSRVSPCLIPLCSVSRTPCQCLMTTRPCLTRVSFPLGTCKVTLQHHPRHSSGSALSLYSVTLESERHRMAPYKRQTHRCRIPCACPG